MSYERVFGLSLHAYLADDWHLARRIDDRHTKTAMHFTGTARFETMDATTLLYSEEGRLQNGALTLNASQRYRWLFDPGGADVQFSDGRAFHRVAPRDNRASAYHDCTPDRYDVRYRFETQDRWYQHWTVTGPRKNYILESVFTRLHHAAYPVQSPRE